MNRSNLLLTKSNVGDGRVGDVEWNQRNDHNQEQSESQAPVEVPGRGLEEAGDLEDDQLEHGQGEGEGE